MANFDINLLSRLEIDTVASRTSINKTVNSRAFKESLDAVRVKVTADMTKREQSSFRASVNRAIKSATAGKDGKGNSSTIKVGIEVDQAQAVRSLNRSLEQAAKQLKSIKVDIDARVDSKTLQAQLDGQAGKNKGSGNLDAVSRSAEEAKRRGLALQKQINAEERAGAVHRDAIKRNLIATNAELNKSVNLGQALESRYRTSEDFQKRIEQAVRKTNAGLKETDNLSTVSFQNYRNHLNVVERTTAQLSFYNTELQKTQQLTATIKQNSLGTWDLESTNIRDTSGEKAVESRNKAVRAIENEIASNRKLIASGSDVQSVLERQNVRYQELLKNKTLTNNQAQKEIATNKNLVLAKRQEAKATDLQIKMLNQHQKHMQQNKRFIDRRGMKELEQQIRNVNLQATNAVPQLNKMNQTMTGYVNRAAQATRSQMGLIENFNNAMVKFPIWMAASTLFFGAIRSSRAFISNIIEIDSRMVTLQKVMSDSADMEKVFNDAQVSAERFGQTLKDVLDAYAEFARQGYEGIDLTNFGNASLIASNVGEISSQEASEFLTAAAAQWQTGSQEAMRQVDSWNEIANNYATTVEKLGEGHAKAGATARAMGLDFHETNAILGALTAQTKQSGSEIGNFIKSAFPRIYAGTGKKVLEDLNIEIETMTGETKSAITLLREVAFAMDDLSTSDRADAIRGLGGVWHYQRMQVLLETLRDVNGMYDQMEDSSRNSFGSAAAENAVYMESLEARINKARVAVEQLSLALGEAFLESGIIDFVESFTIVLGSFSGFIENAGAGLRSFTLAGLVTSLALLSKGFRNMLGSMGFFISRLIESNTRTMALNAQLTTMASRARLSSGAITLLGRALRGLMATTGVGLAIAGVTWGVEALINKMADGKREINEFVQTMEVLKQSLESDADRVKNLVNEHKELEEVIQSGNYSNDQLERYKAVTQELAQLYPDLVQGNADYGTAISNQHGIMETRINLIEQQIEAERELLRVQQLQRHETSVEAAIEAGKELKKIMDEALESTNKALAGRDHEILLNDGTYTTVNDRYFQQLETMLENASSYEDLTNILEELNNVQSIVSSDDAINENQRERITGWVEELRTGVQALTNDYDLQADTAMQLALIQEGSFATVELAVEKVRSALELQGIDDSAFMNFFGSMSNQTALAIDDFETLQRISEEYTKLLSNESGHNSRNAINGLSDALAEYNSVMQDTTSTDEQRYQAFLKIEPLLKTIKGDYVMIARENGATSDEIARLITLLDIQADSLLNVSGATSGVISDQESFNNAMLESTDTSDGLTDSLEEQVEVYDKLTDALKALDKEMDTISQAMEQIGELGALETDTLYDLLDLYPELMGMQLDSAGMVEFLQSKHDEAHQKKISNYLDEMGQSEAVMQAIIADEDHKLRELLRAYDIDLDSFTTLNELKNHLAHNLSKEQLLSNEDVINQLGKAYGLDMENFQSLAEAKAAIEAELMKAIIEEWNNYISQLNSQLGEFAKKYKGAEGIGLLKRDYAEVEMNLSGGTFLDNEGARTRYEGNARDIIGLNDALKQIEMRELSLNLAGINYNAKEFSAAINDAGGIIGDSLDGAGDRARKRLNEASRGSSGSSGGKGSSSSTPTKEELKELNIEVERQVKTFQKQTFVLDQYEESLRKINNQLERQRIKTNSYATHSRNYRKALEEEIKLNQKKLEVMKEQEKSLAQQIKSGNIERYGMISEDVNVSYNQYNVSGNQDVAGVVQRSGGNQISPFGNWRMSYNYGKRNLFKGETYHYGADFVAPSGTPVRTPHGGKVIRAGWGTGGQGNWVAIYNEALDKTFSFMHMLSGLNVKVGDVVEAGTMLGRMGSTGRSTGTHTHFQVNQGMSTSNAKAINPSNYLTSMPGSWLGQVGQLKNEMSTGVRDYTGASLSAERAEYLNALEQAQLSAIEQRINKHNENQQRRSDVQEAQERLDQLTLERLNLMAEIRQQMHEITLSTIEEFNVNSSILDHKIAQLEYDAERLSRKAGETSDGRTWRTYMEKAMEERRKQTKFKEEQIDFIQKILKEDSKRNAENRMSERSRFELEETLRAAKEELIGLLQQEDSIVTSLFESRTNEVINIFEDQMNALDRQMQAIETKRRYIDQTYNDGARDYRNTIREELALNQQRIETMNKSLVQLKDMRSELKQQPELYQQVTDKIYELEDSLADAHATAFELNKEIYSNRVEKAFEGLNEGLEQAKSLFDELEHQLHFVDSELQKDIYFNLQSDVLVEMDNYRRVIEENITLLEAMATEVEEYPEIHKQVTDELKNWKDQHKQVTKDMHTNRQQYTSAFLNSIKTIYQKQQELAISAIDKEYSEFEKMINKRIELIDKQKEDDDYARDITDRQDELVKLRTEIAQRMGDDSLQNQARLKELREELAKREDDYNRFVSDKERERQKEALREELEDAQESAEERREGVNKMFEDMLNDHRKFNEIQEALMQGQVDKYKEMYEGLAEFINDNTQEIGRSISEGLLDSLVPPFEALLSIAGLLSDVSGNVVPTPISGLRPTEPVIPETLANMIRGTSNTLDTNLFPRQFAPLNINSVPPSSNNNNYNNSIQSLVNIENFRGTQKDKDEFLAFLKDELRKSGVVL